MQKYDDGRLLDGEETTDECEPEKSKTKEGCDRNVFAKRQKSTRANKDVFTERFSFLGDMAFTVIYVVIMSLLFMFNSLLMFWWQRL